VALPVAIAKNQTAGDIDLTDIDLTVPASSQITLTDYVKFYEAAASVSLNTEINNDTILINDGIQDLTKAESLDYLDTTGNLNGPVTGSAAGKIVRLLDTTGRYTEAAGNVIHDPAAADPAAGSAGDMYYNTVLEMWMSYDATRGKWLSFEGDTFQVGQNGTVPVGVYYKGVAGKTLSASLGYTAPFNGTVVSLTYTRTDSDLTAHEVMASGAQIESVSSAATSGYDNSLDGDFSQGNILAVRNDSAGNATRDAQIWVRLKWRA
jgi:hypothetical protein